MAVQNCWTFIFVKAAETYNTTSICYSVDTSIKLLEHHLFQASEVSGNRHKKNQWHSHCASIAFFFWRISEYIQIHPHALLWRKTRFKKRNITESIFKILKLCKNSLPHIVPFQKTLSETDFFRLSNYISLLLPQQTDRFVDKIKFVPKNNEKYSDNQFDPVTCNSVRLFRKISNLTPCPYALLGKYWGTPDWNKKISFEDNCRTVSGVLKLFLRTGRTWGFDGLVIMLPAYFSLSIEILATTFHKFLKTLLLLDKNSDYNLEQSATQDTWSFTCFGESMFITTFGVCYKINNPRYTFGIDKTIFFLQPDFTLRSLSALMGEAEITTRQKIKEIFLARKMPYTNIKSPNEAQRYVRSHPAGEKIVEWWNTP